MSNHKFKVGDKVRFIDTKGIEEYIDPEETRTVIYINHTGGLVGVNDTINDWGWDVDRFELIEEENTVSQSKKFNPKLGDKIICNNGQEYTCCTLEYLQEVVSAGINTNKPILGIASNGYSWQDWDQDGIASVRYPGYNILEVIPQAVTAWLRLLNNKRKLHLMRQK